MAKTSLVNLLVNEWSLSREWLNQFQAQELSEMLQELREKLGKA